MSKNVRNSDGYTLLEIILALGIMCVLLVMLGTLMQNYSMYLASGTRRAESSQLVRSLAQLLDEDLGAAIQDPVHPHTGPLSGEDSVRRFGLRGTEKSLRIDVVQINPFKPVDESPKQRAAARGTVTASDPQVPELKTVYYDFFELSPLNSQSRSRSYCGLSRSELDFETPLEVLDLPDAGSANTDFAHAITFDPWNDDPFAEESSKQSSAPEVSRKPKSVSGAPLDDAYTMWAPEVVDCRFRYSDGNGWSGEWDSIERNGLPVAIEVTLKLMPLADVDQVRRAKKTAPTLERTCQELGLAQPSEQRIVTYLATSPLKKHVEYARKQPPRVRGGRGGSGGTGRAISWDGGGGASTPLLQQEPGAPPAPSNPKPPEPIPNPQEWIRR